MVNLGCSLSFRGVLLVMHMCDAQLLVHAVTCSTLSKARQMIIGEAWATHRHELSGNMGCMLGSNGGSCGNPARWPRQTQTPAAWGCGVAFLLPDRPWTSLPEKPVCLMACSLHVAS